MKERQKRIKCIQTQLMDMYSDLFGAQYSYQDQLGKESEFQTIIQKFKQKHFFIREMQKDRQKKEKKGATKVVEQLQNNQQIREELKKCELLLKQAQQRISTDLKKEERAQSERMRKKREVILSQCLEMLANINSVEYGETYNRKKQHFTLQQFKKNNNRQDVNDEINLEEEQALERFEEKDRHIDGYITQIRKANKEVKYELNTANQAINITKEMIEKNLVKADKVEMKIKKGTNDLVEVLKQYRKPSKLCLDIILILLILALIGVIINMVRTSKV